LSSCVTQDIDTKRGHKLRVICSCDGGKGRFLPVQIWSLQLLSTCRLPVVIWTRSPFARRLHARV